MTRPPLRSLPISDPPPSLPPFLAAGASDNDDMLVCPKLERFVRAHLARHFLRPLRTQRPPAFGLVAGPPGEGKTTQCEAIISRAGVDLVTVSGAAFASATEDGGVRAFDKMLSDIEKIRAARGLPIAALIDDADLGSIATGRAHVEYTIASFNLLGRLQKFADDVANRAPLPLFLLVNEVEVFRASLIRDGRAVVHVHQPTAEEKVPQVARLYDASTPEQLEQIRARIAAHPHRPLAFYKARKQAAADTILDDVLSALEVHDVSTEGAIKKRMAALCTDDFIAAIDSAPDATHGSFLPPNSEHPS